MGILAWIVVGLVAGWLVNRLMKDENDIGMVRESLIGVVGAIISGFIAALLLRAPRPLIQINLATVVVAAVGAVALVALMRSSSKSSAV